MSAQDWSSLVERLLAEVKRRPTVGSPLDDAAWEDLQSRLLRMARLLVDADEVDDVVQAVALKLQSVAALSRMRAARSAEGYAFMMVRNAGIDLERRRSRKPVLVPEAADNMADIAIGQDELLEQRVRGEELEGMLPNLQIPSGSCSDCASGRTYRLRRLRGGWKLHIRRLQCECSGSSGGFGHDWREVAKCHISSVLRQAVKKPVAAASLTKGERCEPLQKGHGMNLEKLLTNIDENWRRDFITFVQTGDASQEFLAYLDNDHGAQAAVEEAFTAQAQVFEGLAQLVKSGITAPKTSTTERASTAVARAVEGLLLCQATSARKR